MSDCDVGRRLINRLLPGWAEPCPEPASNDVVMALMGEVLHFCDGHIYEFVDRMDDIEEVTGGG